MTYSEFTELTKKEIDYNYYTDVIEPMYLASDLNKADFIKLLNVAALPESEQSKMKAESDILELKKDLEYYKSNKRTYQKNLKFWQDEKDDEMIKSVKSNIKYYEREIKKTLNQINEIKFIYDV